MFLVLFSHLFRTHEFQFSAGLVKVLCWTRLWCAQFWQKYFEEEGTNRKGQRPGLALRWCSVCLWVHLLGFHILTELMDCCSSVRACLTFSGDVIFSREARPRTFLTTNPRVQIEMLEPTIGQRCRNWATDIDPHCFYAAKTALSVNKQVVRLCVCVSIFCVEVKHFEILPLQFWMAKRTRSANRCSPWKVPFQKVFCPPAVRQASNVHRKTPTLFQKQFCPKKNFWWLQMHRLVNSTNPLWCAKAGPGLRPQVAQPRCQYAQLGGPGRAQGNQKERKITLYYSCIKCLRGVDSLKTFKKQKQSK